MGKRGRIVRDPTAGAGLVMVQGRQHAFGLEGVWKSDTLPRPGVVVDVEFDDAGRVTGMMAVSEARLAREQAEAAIAFATASGAAAATSLAARVGRPQIAALGLLALGWFWLPALDVGVAAPLHWQVTLWHALGALNAGRPLEALASGPSAGAGLFGAAALACFAGPLLPQLCADRRAHLAAALPLAFMVLAALRLFGISRWGVADLPVVSLGAGTYVSALAGLYLALAGLKRYLVAKARETAVFHEAP